MDITVSDTPPNIDIQFPIGDALLYSNRAYTFEAVVSDPDRPDGHVPCQSVQWSILDPQSYRVVGHGCEITVNGLTLGLNVVNVHATDSTGSESSFAVRYHVLP